MLRDSSGRSLGDKSLIPIYESVASYDAQKRKGHALGKAGTRILHKKKKGEASDTIRHDA